MGNDPISFFFLKINESSANNVLVSSVCERYCDEKDFILLMRATQFHVFSRLF